MASGRPDPVQDFEVIFGDIFAPMDEMIELHAALKQRKIPTFIFSNTNEIAIEHIRRTYPFFDAFDGYVFSYEHGAMKPTAKLYEVVERMTGRKGDQLVYIDDKAENIAAGKERGRAGGADRREGDRMNDSRKTAALPRLTGALRVQVLPDGGLKSRSPQAALELLLDLLTLDDALLQLGREAPQEVSRAIDRLTGTRLENKIVDYLEKHAPRSL